VPARVRVRSCNLQCAQAGHLAACTKVHAAPGRCRATIHERYRSIAIAAVQARNLLSAERMDIIGIVLALLVASYLTYALLRPERF
jgi:K+-transporting ATPase KdpF subunit